jgi:hypothetical protein
LIEVMKAKDAQNNNQKESTGAVTAAVFML